MRDYDNELLSVARLKKGADDTIHDRIDSAIKAVRVAYGAGCCIVALAIWLFTIRYDLNKQIEARQGDRKLLNQLYLKIYGVEVTFY